MKRNKFRMRSEPEIPEKFRYPDKETRETILYSFGTEDIGKLISTLQKIENKDPNAKVEIYEDGSGCYYESDTPTITLCVVRYEDTYQDALDGYRGKLSKYTTWYKENEEAIKTELELRAVEQRDADLRKADRLEIQAKALRKNA